MEREILHDNEIRQFYRPHEVSPVDPETMDKYVRDYEGKRNELVTAAALDRDNAVSYRDFKVGCAIMTKDPNQAEGEYSIYSGYNYKPEPAEQEGVAKRCAEKMALEKALANLTEQVVAIVSVSDKISTGTSTKAHDALHPCEECRKMIRQLVRAGLLNKKGIVCNVNDTRMGPDGKWATEERTVGDLLDEYSYEEQAQAA